jgi:neutral/alkaline ceramidase-like enzyme
MNQPFQKILSGMILAGFLGIGGAQLSPDKQPDPVPMSNLRAGVARVDITPPLSVPLAGYADRTGPASGIHDPLHAAVIVFDDGRRKTAIVTLDVLDISEANGEAVREAIQRSAGIDPDYVLINVSHTHGSPVLESDANWRNELVAKVAGATRLAADRLRPVSLGYGEGTIDFNTNRRVINDQGICIAGLNPDGVCDRRVKVVRVDDGDSIEPMAVLMHAVCHANVYRMGNTQITADFPGVAKAFVEKSFGGRTVALYLQGCSGNVRANLPGAGAGYTNNTADFGRSGNDVDMTWAGWSLGAEAVRVAARARVREQLRDRGASYDIAAAARTLKVSADPDRLAANNRNQVVDGKIDFPVRAVRIGDFWFVGLPGEPVVEYGLQIEERMKGLGKVMVLGYGSGDASYVPVAHMIEEGGYEVEGGAYSEASEREILDGVQALVERVAPRGR